MACLPPMVLYFWLSLMQPTDGPPLIDTPVGEIALWLYIVLLSTWSCVLYLAVFKHRYSIAFFFAVWLTVIELGDAMLAFDPSATQDDLIPFFKLTVPGTVILYLLAVRFCRYSNVQSIKDKYGFTDDSRSFACMTIEQAEEIKRNISEVEFPWLFEFGWNVEFLKTSTTPVLSRLICSTGHFTHPDADVRWKRQQDTAYLMKAIMAQPLNSEYSCLALARINEHHNRYGSRINSDTSLYLAVMWMQGPIQWIKRAGYRQLEPFEEQALWIFWRELALRLGCKWVPYTRHEALAFAQEYERKAVYPDPWNTLMSNAIVDMFAYHLPPFLKPLGRRVVVSILDEGCLWANGLLRQRCLYTRAIAFFFFKMSGLWVRYLCMNRTIPVVLSPEQNPDHKPIAWPSLGAKLPTALAQITSEVRVRATAADMAVGGWGWRAPVRYQAQPLVVDASFGPGYGISGAPGYAFAVAQNEKTCCCW